MQEHDSHNAETQEPQNPPPEKTRAPIKPQWTRILIAAVSVCVILFAFYWEARGERIREAEEAMANYPPPVRCEIQNELNELDWVIQEFLPINEMSRPGILITEINGIVIHNIGNPNTTAMQNRNFFANLAITRERHASSTFIICLDGKIIQCVPVDEIAYASNHRNDDTLSIELCHPDDTGQFTAETYESAVRLTAWLCERFGVETDDIIRHYDVIGKACPRFFVENEEAWETFKADVAHAMHREAA